MDRSLERQVKIYEKRKRMLITFLILLVLIFLIAVFSVVFALTNAGNQKIVAGVYIKDINVSNLNLENAKNKLKSNVEDRLINNIAFKYKDEFESTISPNQIEALYDIEQMANSAYLVGRSGNVIQDNYSILRANLFTKKMPLIFKYNNEILDYLIEDMSSKLPGALKESSYYIDGEKLVITKGTTGVVIRKQELINNILYYFNNIDEKIEFIEIPVETKEPKPVDIQEIHNQVYKQAKDAYYTESPFEIYAHENGVDFDIDEAKKKLESEDSECIIQLKITRPKIETNKLGINVFPDLLSKIDTKYDVTNKNRANNLELAADKINGVIVLPGETFSYNKTVGERTIDAGYKEAAIYSGGKVVDGLGGGICQISTILYDAALYANLEIVERRNHQFKPSYVEAGLDATVVYGSTDFKFKNTRKYPIKIEVIVKNGIARVSMYGIKEEVEYKVEIIPEIMQATPYETVYLDDSKLKKGEERVLQSGGSGLKVETYKILKLGDAVVSKTLISKDTYNPMERIIARGK